MCYVMQFGVKLLVLVSLQSAVAINWKNNACHNIFSYYFSAVSRNCYENDDVRPNDLPSISKRHGYDTETFTLTTGDGYELHLYRMSSTNTQTTKIPLFVLHGIAIDVESWVDIGNRSLAFNLVDGGYDVWVGTLRGTIDSNKHKTLTVNDPEYWNFNLDTITKEDLRIQLEFVANATQEKAVIVAHSMGCTLSFMFGSEYPDRANQLIKGLVALAPVVYLDDVPFTTSALLWAMPLIQIFKAFNIKGLLYHEKLVHSFETHVCKLLPNLCYFLVSTASGKTKQFAPEDLLLFTSYWPSGVSVYQLEHFLQISKDHKFQKYDYGTHKNKEIYGTENPPVYNLTNVQFPVSLFYGTHDVLFLQKNIDRLFNELGSSQKYKISVPRNAGPEYGYSHIDFLWSKNLHKFLYDDVFEKLDLIINDSKGPEDSEDSEYFEG
ncbi:hypothetical protein Zmor_025172 [Zophobas morio]|uniref:Lipase n=1 Tax=Zophobas morio TaxID=2755281 RepID=A0AA38HR22_9CUCU|nr:hypothetical protein Zmor_025172 [Zophobas morio]